MYVDSDEVKALQRQVFKANELIQKSRFNLSLQQQKIILYLISKIQPQDDELKLYEFNIADFCRTCGIDIHSGSNYQNLKSSIKEIADKSIWVELADGKQTLLRWVEKAYIEPNNGTIQIKLDNDMIPFLLNLKKNFTSYELIYITNMSSRFSIRLFELVHSIHYHELEEYQREFDLDELRKLLGAEHYTKWINFRQRVLDPAIKEINKHSDKNIIMEPIKKGNTIVKVRLIITTKDTFEALKIKDEIMKSLGYVQETLWDELESRGMIQ